MVKFLSKKSIIILILSLGTISVAEEIKLKDESSQSNLVQKTIVGCEEGEGVAKQNRDLEEIKKQLAFILKKLSELENKDDSKEKREDISNIKNCLSQLTEEKKSKERAKRRVYKKKKYSRYKKDYTVVVVEKGDRLSDYAKKYYGDKRKYYRIYKANRDKIAEDMKLSIGDVIIIPLSSNYKHKRFKRVKHIIKKKKTIPTKYIPKESLDKYPMAKIFTESNEEIEPTINKVEPTINKIEMLEEPVFVDDDKIDNSGFLPLDDN